MIQDQKKMTLVLSFQIVSLFCVDIQPVYHPFSDESSKISNKNKFNVWSHLMRVTHMIRNELQNEWSPTVILVYFCFISSSGDEFLWE